MPAAARPVEDTVVETTYPNPLAPQVEVSFISQDDVGEISLHLPLLSHPTLPDFFSSQHC